MIFCRKFKNALAAVILCLLPLATACAEEVQALAAKPLMIHTANGVIMFQTEMAFSPQDQARGLMYRKELATNKAMLFVFDEIREASFWMENTLVPLDMLFIDETGKIVHVHKMAKPLDRSPIPSGQPVKAVLEILGGEADKQGIKVGDTIDPALFKSE